MAVPVSAYAAPGLVVAVSVSGHGFGHGVGLSQWGAEERASVGYSHRQILRFYYPGTQLGRARSRTVRVLIGSRSRLVVGSRAGFTVRDTGGRILVLPAGRYRVSRAMRLGGQRLRPPLIMTPSGEPLTLGGRPCGGTFTVALVGGRLQAVNTINLEHYVAEVVSCEVPAGWHREALRAQAIASRS